MATTIVTKKGSGAPAASDLVEGELAVDTTNGRLYTENSSAAVVELGSNPSGNITFGDNGKAIFGAGSDLQIYHDGSNSYISDQGTGDLRILAGDFRIRNAADDETMIQANVDGDVSLWYNNSKKLATTNTGIQVTGDIANASGDLTLDVAGDIILDADGADVIIKDGGTSFLEIDKDGDNARLKNPITNGDILIQGIDGASTITALAFDMSAAGAATFNAGINLAGTITTTAATPSLIFYESDTTDVNTQLISASGDFRIRTRSDDGSTNTERLRIDHGTGDISFYEDTGNTPKFFWDASAESLGIGTTSLTSNATLSVAQGGVHVDGGASGGSSQVILSTGASSGSNFGQISNTGTRWALGYGGTPQTVGTEVLTWNSSNNVGIGREPRVMLDVAGEAAIAYNPTYGLRFYNQDQNNWSSIGNNIATGSSTANLVFKDASGEAFRLDGSGNLLVGKTALDNTTAGTRINSDGSASFVKNGNLLYLNRTTTDGDIVTFAKDNTAVGSIGVGSTRLTIGSASASGLRFDGANVMPMASGALSDAAVDIGYSSNRFRTGYFSGDVNATNFTGVGDGDTFIGMSGSNVMRLNTGGHEAARIDASQNFLVGTSSSTGSGASSGRQLIQFNGAATNGLYIDDTRTSSGTDIAIVFGRGSTYCGKIETTTAPATNFVSASDQRLKENIADADDAGSKIDAIQVRKYDWIGDGTHQEYGLVAQELQPIAPLAVSGDADSEEMMGVDYSKLVPMMLKEIQSLRARVAQLES